MTTVNTSRTTLIEVGLRVFGERGFEGAGVRLIAQAANTPISAITYHFGGKQGFYLACAQHIADVAGGFMTPALAASVVDLTAADRVARARVALTVIMAGLLDAMVRQETGGFSRFIMREQAEPTEAFAIIYDGMMGQVVERVAQLVRIIAGGTISEMEAKVRALAIMGQAMAFRVARAAVLRTTGWREVGTPETAIVQSVILKQINAIADQIEQESCA